LIYLSVDRLNSISGDIKRPKKSIKGEKGENLFVPTTTTSIDTITAISSQIAVEGKVKAKIRIEAVQNIEIQQRL
jgi:hypothetical protein